MLMQSTDTVEFVRKMTRPPGRTSRAASGIQRYGISPERGAILRKDKVERRVRKRDLLADRLDEREVEAGVLLQTASRRQLRWCGIDRDDARAATGQPGGEVRGATTQLDDVQARHVAEDVHIGFRLLEDAPGDLLLCPGLRGRRVRVVLVGASPVRDVLLNVVGPVRRAHRPRTRAQPRAPQTPASRSRAPGCPASSSQDRRGSIPAPHPRDSSHRWSCASWR